ncbi:MAG: hypothetical protein PVJ81_05050 [Dehalococcoidia bacterium]|jgi:hypothetical protein
MKAFRVVLLVILGILLSLSLLIFGPALMVNQSALNADFVADRVDEIDIVELTDEIILEEVPPEAADFMGDTLHPVLQYTIGEIEPWLKEQARNVIHVFYDYIEGRNDTLSLIIPLEEKVQNFRDNLLDAILTSPPAELLGLDAEEIEAEFNVYFDQIDEEIPSEIDLEEILLGEETVEQIERARQYVGYFNTGFIMLIAFCLLLILLIILVYREVKGSCRQIGITFLAVGVVSLVGAFVARSIANSQLATIDMPATLQAWAPNVVFDVLLPLGIYAIGLIAVGIAMTVVSFVYKRDEYSDYYY